MQALIFIVLKSAEGMGFEPTTPCGAPDFESGRWPIRLPSEADASAECAPQPARQAGPRPGSPCGEVATRERRQPAVIYRRPKNLATPPAACRNSARSSADRCRTRKGAPSPAPRGQTPSPYPLPQGRGVETAQTNCVRPGLATAAFGASPHSYLAGDRFSFEFRHWSQVSVWPV